MTQQTPPPGYEPGPAAYPVVPAGPGYPPGPQQGWTGQWSSPAGPPSFPPSPPSAKSRVLIVGIVAGAVVLLAVIGALVMVFHQPQPVPVAITPAAPTQPGPADPTTTTDRPTGQPTARSTTVAQPTEPTNPDRVLLAEGIGVVPAPLYKLQDKGPGYASFSNGNDIFIARVVRLAASADPGRRCVDELTSVNQGASALKIPTPQPVNGNPSLRIVTCQSSAIFSDGGGSRIAYAGAVVSVRQRDGVTIVGTALFNTSSVPSQVNQDVSAMVNTMLRDQAGS